MVFIEITIFFIMRSLFSYHNIIMYHADIHIIKYWSPCRNKKDKKDKAHHDDFFHGQSPLGFQADRYRSFPHNHHLHEEEVYDEIKDENRTSKVSNLNYRNGPQNNGNIGSYSKDEYLTPSFAGENGQDSYLTPVSLHDKDSSDYTVLPAVTLPIDQITAKYNPGGGDTMNQENGEYVEPKDLNMPKTRGKKISISDQGEVVYTDVSQHRRYANENMVNRPYTSLSTIRSKRWSGQTYNIRHYLLREVFGRLEYRHLETLHCISLKTKSVCILLKIKQNWWSKKNPLTFTTWYYTLTFNIWYIYIYWNLIPLLSLQE